jgi:hypothetical protein
MYVCARINFFITEATAKRFYRDVGTDVMRATRWFFSASDMYFLSLYIAQYCYFHFSQRENDRCTF